MYYNYKCRCFLFAFKRKRVLYIKVFIAIIFMRILTHTLQRNSMKRLKFFAGTVQLMYIGTFLCDVAYVFSTFTTGNVFRRLCFVRCLDAPLRDIE